jgi:hypothetical protein
MKTDGSHCEVSRLIRDSAAGGECFGYNAPSAGRFRATCRVMIMKPQTMHTDCGAKQRIEENQ